MEAFLVVIGIVFALGIVFAIRGRAQAPAKAPAEEAKPTSDDGGGMALFDVMPGPGHSHGSFDAHSHSHDYDGGDGGDGGD